MYKGGFIVLIVFAIFPIDNVKGNGECEVCVKYLTRIQKIIEDEGISGEPAVKKRLREECQKSKGKDNKFCYYIGGTDDAATGMLKQVSTPLSYHKPPEKICADLKKKDADICDLKYDQVIDWKKVNLNKMRVKQLRKILMDWGEDCRGCVEKQEFIDRIKELKPKYVHEEL